MPFFDKVGKQAAKAAKTQAGSPLCSSKAGAGSSSPGQSFSPSKNMGNGASASQIVVDGEVLDFSKVKVLLPDLKRQMKMKDAKIHQFEVERVELERMVRERDDEISRLHAEVDKLKSVLSQTARPEKPDLLSTIHEASGMAGQEARNKKQGVSGESSDKQARQAVQIELRRIQKDFR